MSKGQPPDFNVRVKVGEFWSTIGAAWKVKDGGISIRLNTVPVGWDGSALMLPPKEEKSEPAPE